MGSECPVFLVPIIVCAHFLCPSFPFLPTRSCSLIPVSTANFQGLFSFPLFSPSRPRLLSSSVQGGELELSSTLFAMHHYCSIELYPASFRTFLFNGQFSIFLSSSIFFLISICLTSFKAEVMSFRFISFFLMRVLRIIWGC